MTLDETQQVNLLQGLLEQYSPTLAESPAVAYLAKKMQRLGYQVSVDAAGSVTGILGSGPRKIILLGHIDTVPGDIPVRQEGDLLFGRGAVDAKGPLACFTAAAALAGALPGWQLVVIGAVGEEGDSRGAKLVRDQYLVNGCAPDFCIIGEPSRWDQVTLGYKGSAWFDYTIERSLTHTASQAESACESAVGFWNRARAAMDQFNTSQPRVFDQITRSLREMHSSKNGFSETANLKFNLRLPPGCSVSQAVEMLGEHAGEGQLILQDGIECYRADKNTPLVRAFLSSIRQQGGKPGFLVKTGTSDMNIVGPAWNCPILAYGPGDSSLDHTPNEHIAVTEYLRGVRTLQQALQNLQTAP